MPKDFDDSALTRRLGPRVRLAALASNNLNVAGATLAVLLMLVPLAILVGLLTTGNATDVGGLVVLALCCAAGVLVLVQLVGSSNGAAVLLELARDNDLEPLSGSIAPHYAGSLFADESHAVHQGLRTRDHAFREVGDLFPTAMPRGSRQTLQRRIYLRARLTGTAHHGPTDADLVTPELRAALTRLAGAHHVEVSGDELTVVGSRALDPARRGRVKKALALADALADRADAVLVTSAEPAATEHPFSTLSGVPIPPTKRPPAPRGRTRGPLAIVGWTLALMVGGPVAIAIVMSILDDALKGDRWVASVVVGLVVAVTLALVGRAARAAVTPRRTDDDAHSKD